MIAIAKTLFIGIALFYIAIIDTNLSILEFKCDVEKTIKYTLEECEEKNQDDKQKNNFFTYLTFSNLAVNYLYKQKKYTFQISTTHFKPPIAS